MIRKYMEWQSSNHREKRLYTEMNYISTMAQMAGLSKAIIDEASVYHRTLTDSGHSFRGNNKVGLLAASIYLSCKAHGCPRTPKEIADMFQLDHASAALGCKNAQTILANCTAATKANGLATATTLTTAATTTKATVTNTNSGANAPIHAHVFIERYCSMVGLSQEITKVCYFVAMYLEQRNLLAENTSNSVAVSVIYYVCMRLNQSVNKEYVCRVGNVSTMTVSNCYKKLLQLAEHAEFIPSVILQKYAQPNTADKTQPSNADKTPQIQTQGS
jgi:transcription initiation factor TFIIIB Brf1 subunit/transcription initiation factor TFIIB